jgi:chloramphenicol 3-O-phosphotransferase
MQLFKLGARIWRVAHGDFKLDHPRKGTEGPRVHLSNTMADSETILLFCVDATRAGSVVAKGLNNDLEIVADNLICLRESLVDQLDRLGVDGKIVGIRTDAPTAAV